MHSALPPTPPPLQLLDSVLLGGYSIAHIHSALLSLGKVICLLLPIQIGFSYIIAS